MEIPKFLNSVTEWLKSIFLFVQKKSAVRMLCFWQIHSIIFSFIVRTADSPSNFFSLGLLINKVFPSYLFLSEMTRFKVIAEILWLLFVVANVLSFNVKLFQISLFKPFKGVFWSCSRYLCLQLASVIKLAY